MNATNFLTSNHIIALPTRSNPKVYLSIDNPVVTKLAFSLYNPFSTKAKVLKATVKFLCVYFNKVAKFIMPTIKSEKSDFMMLMEKHFSSNLTSSVYFATEKDKLVIQLQNENNHYV